MDPKTWAAEMVTERERVLKEIREANDLLGQTEQAARLALEKYLKSLKTVPTLMHELLTNYDVPNRSAM